ncbi:MAG: hypothetical protein GEU79_00695 [Acidimicrobiia bacterium]|nr:hypothetical protein [Acidimicrobiia bacterium]
MSIGGVVILAWGVAGGIHPLGAILIALTLLDPRWGALVFLALVIFSRRRNRVDAVVGARRFFERVSAELGVGMSLRSALIEGVATLPPADGLPLRRRLEAGIDVVEVGETLASTLPLAGESLPAAVGVASTGGGPSGAVFTGLGLDVAEEAELLRERRVLTTQARFTSLIVGGAPLAYLLFELTRGTLGERFQTPHGTVLTIVGGSLVLVGVTWVYVQLRRTHGL